MKKRRGKKTRSSKRRNRNKSVMKRRKGKSEDVKAGRKVEEIE